MKKEQAVMCGLGQSGIYNYSTRIGVTGWRRVGAELHYQHYIPSQHALLVESVDQDVGTFEFFLQFHHLNAKHLQHIIIIHN